MTRLAASWHGMSPSNTLLRSCTAGCPVHDHGRASWRSDQQPQGYCRPDLTDEEASALSSRAMPWPRLIRLEDAATPLAREIGKLGRLSRALAVQPSLGIRSRRPLTRSA